MNTIIGRSKTTTLLLLQEGIKFTTLRPEKGCACLGQWFGLIINCERINKSSVLGVKDPFPMIVLVSLNKVICHSKTTTLLLLQEGIFYTVAMNCDES